MRSPRRRRPTRRSRSPLTPVRAPARGGVRGRLDALPRPARLLVDWGGTLLVAVGIVLVLRACVVTPYRVPSAVMEPTLHCEREAAAGAAGARGCTGEAADRVLVNRIAYRLRDPKRKDIVAVEMSEQAARQCGLDEGDVVLLRVLGLPGETLTFARGLLAVDGERVQEPYVAAAGGAAASRGRGACPPSAGSCSATTASTPATRAAGARFPPRRCRARCSRATGPRGGSGSPPRSLADRGRRGRGRPLQFRVGRRAALSMSDVIQQLEREQLRDGIPQFKAGDTVRVHFQVIEGQRRRVQVFEGIVIKRQGAGARETFTVRKQSFGVGVERTFPLHSPKIEKIDVASIGDVNRAKLYYLRGKVGKKARVRELRTR